MKRFTAAELTHHDSYIYQVCLSHQHLLTRVRLKHNFSLSVDFLGPVFGAVRSGKQLLKVSVQLGLLGLSQFLLGKLEQKNREQQEPVFFWV